MSKIILTQNPTELDTSRWSNPIWIYDDSSYDVDGCDSILMDEFRESPREIVKEYDTAVFIGLSSMMTPSNRTDDIWEFTFNQMETNAVSVDEYLFRSDPWRTWFHFGLVDAEYRDYTYSYLAETDYEKYFNKKTDDNPFSADEIYKWGEGIIESHYDEYFTSFDVEVGYEVSTSEEYEYSELVDGSFETKNTVGQVKRELESYADEIYDERDVPSRHQLFRTGNRDWNIRITDLPVDKWKVSYLNELVELTNTTLQQFNKQ